ncbi:hypothetical protein GCM10009840_33020 [Pseudolysinimonas kribbensis]|uniref:Glycosyl transferase family 1 domain-containing protein n=1 Tax=Pseudolysinimonas kribbensis TaxID=433641 RepID=A0ABQ6K1U9_9MICO|nr:glycosyltransferase family 1 protein [Pseudolysinimonas kribbensis]GMA93414.1 hypothetical protein GCM10025881_02380 [Pseudolysinimonas kribbensis]
MNGVVGTLRILVDAYWWLSGPPSGRNVVIGMVTGWARTFPDDALTLLVRPDEADRIARDLERRGIAATVRPVSRLARIHAVAARRAGRAAVDHDAVITQNFATRTGTAVSAVLVHDAMYVDHPEWFTLPERAYLRLLRPSLRAAHLIFTTSSAETARIGRVWPETRDRLRRVGLDVPIDLVALEPRRPDAIAPGEEFILTVGRLNVRKNLRRLIDAYLGEDEVNSRHRLVVVGAPDGASEVLPGAAGGRVRFLRDVDDAELRWLYAHARLFVLPSLDEGFGLPLLEARAAGTPAIASDLPVFREQEAEGWFDPRSTTDIARALRNALAHEPRRRTPDPDRPGSASTPWASTVERMRGAVTGIRHEERAHVAPA